MWFIVSLLLSATPVGAMGSVKGKVILKEPNGTAAASAGAVVYLVGFTEPPPETPARMVQKNQSFNPPVLPLTLGQTVDFANEDPIWHNVFSVSKARAFDLGMTRKPESKSVTFSKTGVIDVYCNIHPQMVGTLLVLPNRAFSVTNSKGEYAISNVPPGTYKAYVWSRRSDPQNKPVTIEVNAPTTLDFDVVQDKMIEQHKDKHGRDYKAAPKY